MFWTKNKVAYYLYWWGKVYWYEMEQDPDTMAQPHKRRKHTDAYFVGPCLNYIDVNKAFGLLDDLAQQVLSELYIDRSEDCSTNTETIIRLKWGARNEVAQKLGMEYNAIRSIEKTAFGVMIEYLNK